MRYAAFLFLPLFACRPATRAPEQHPSPRVAVATSDARDASAPPPLAEAKVSDAEVQSIPVAKDSPASVVRGTPGTTPHIVFMPGLCSNAYAYLLSFPNAARTHGGIVAIDGDQPCPGAKGFHSFSWNPSLQRARIEAALAAAGVGVPDGGLTLVGYSAGASIAELMQQRWPELFTHLVLIAPPVDPKPTRLRKAHGVVAMSCSYDVPWRMKNAARELERISVPATYLEMPRCTHGTIADGEHVFDDAFGWLEGRP